MSSQTVAVPSGVRLSASAARRLTEMKRAEGNDALMLRIAVAGGGCSGFQYQFSLDERTGDDDRVFGDDGARVVVDETSLELLAGAEVDYVEELAGSYFKVDNPNAKSSCGCGSSFSTL